MNSCDIRLLPLGGSRS